MIFPSILIRVFPSKNFPKLLSAGVYVPKRGTKIAMAKKLLDIVFHFKKKKKKKEIVCLFFRALGFFSVPNFFFKNPLDFIVKIFNRIKPTTTNNIYEGWTKKKRALMMRCGPGGDSGVWS